MRSRSGRTPRSGRSRRGRSRAGRRPSGAPAAMASRTPRTSAPSSSGSGRVGAPRRPELAREADHLGADRDVLALGRGQDPLRRERLGAHRVAHLRGEQRPRRGGPRPRWRAGRRRAGGSRRRRPRPGRSRPRRSRRGSSAATAGSVDGGASAAASASSISSSMPGSCRSAVSVWNRPTGRPGVPTSVARAASRTAGSPSSRPAVEVSRSASGANSRAMQREQAVAEEVDPVERVPGVLAQLRLGEPARPRARRRAGRDRWRRRAAGRSSRANVASQRSVDGQPLGPAGRRSGPASARRGVLADRGREDRVEPEVLGEERVDGGGEVGHADRRLSSARSSRKSQPRVSPGSMRTTVPPRSSS